MVQRKVIGGNVKNKKEYKEGRQMFERHSQISKRLFQCLGGVKVHQVKWGWRKKIRS